MAYCTSPSTSANSVWSRPIPTLAPAWKRVPRCRTMMEPAGTVWPPNTFTPSILGWESRPFRVEPPPFFCAMVQISLMGSGVDRTDFDLIEVLAMALPLLIMLATAHLEDAHLVVPAVADHRGLDDGACNQGSPDLQIGAATDSQHLVDRDLLADIRSNLFYLDLLACGNLVLLAAGFYDRVHISLSSELTCATTLVAQAPRFSAEPLIVQRSWLGHHTPGRAERVPGVADGQGCGGPATIVVQSKALR